MANLINKPFITIEDINTTLLMFEKGLRKELVVDTSFITQNGLRYEYEFLTISKSEENSSVEYEITFPTLFGYPNLIIENYDEYDISIDAGSVTVTLNTQITDAPIINLTFDNNITISTDDGFYLKKHYYTKFTDETIAVQLYNKFDQSETFNREIKIEMGDKQGTVTTDSTGLLNFSKLNINVSEFIRGEHIVFLSFKKNDTWIKFTSIILNLLPRLFEFKPTSSLYKDALNDIKFHIFGNINDTFFLPSNPILKVNNKTYDDYEIDDDQLLFPNVDLTGFHNDFIDVELILPDTDTQQNYARTFRIECDYASFDELITVSNPTPRTAIVRNEEYTVSLPIDVDNGLNLIFEEEAVLNGVNFNVVNNSTFKLTEGKLEDCNIHIIDGKLDMSDMEVYYSETPLKSEANSEILVNSCSFHDNIGEDILSYGKLTVINSIFTKEDSETLNPLRPAFISLNGETNLNNNVFNILYGEITGNVGLSYVMFSINENSLLNTVKGNNMKNNNTFNRLKNKGTINIQFNNKTIDCSENCFTWTVQNTNTVYHNNIRISEE